MIQSYDLALIEGIDLILIRLSVILRVINDCIKMRSQVKSAVIVDLIACQMAANYIARVVQALSYIHSFLTLQLHRSEVHMNEGLVDLNDTGELWPNVIIVGSERIDRQIEELKSLIEKKSISNLTSTCVSETTVRHIEILESVCDSDQVRNNFASQEMKGIARDI